ncbi:hypothetical protein TSOC_007809 [Tetrabaena socialis]|uniref:NAD(P)-binding domain-containing protein n=1 Tax=Tetrabaena socialis TaxID=47790 RepID=A0A2J8A049_9CHLO|nr:hypothetical protein TSOC_007809 [Tetrabaena socialis]|eukprot:PNH05892.1 hypothetical protein TSOC_007809 [Tetrabaena socialis]
MTGLVAVVVGATGAVGEALVHQAVKNAAFSRVVTIGRRPLEGVPVEGRVAELVQKQVSMDNMEVEAKDAFAGADVVFCALGTTRKVAGSAAAFKKVDFEYVAASARLAKECGAAHFSLVSAQGANARVPANDLGLFHGLLYAKTKGLAEEAVVGQGFQRTSIFRPGMLDRGDKTRQGEKLFLKLAPSLDVRDLARIMLLDTLTAPAAGAAAVARFEMGELRKAAKAAEQPPKPTA